MECRPDNVQGGPLSVASLRSGTAALELVPYIYPIVTTVYATRTHYALAQVCQTVNACE